MATCDICGEPIPDGSRTCSLCGSSVDEFFPAASGLHAPAPSATPLPKVLLPGGSYCPVCVKVYGPEQPIPFARAAPSC